MNCNRCNKEVEEDLIRHFDTLPPMMGYNYVPPCARCMVCCLPVCQECMTGLGMFNFACKADCGPDMNAYLEGKQSRSPRTRKIKKYFDQGMVVEEVCKLTGMTEKLAQHYHDMFFKK